MAAAATAAGSRPSTAFLPARMVASTARISAQSAAATVPTGTSRRTTKRWRGAPHQHFPPLPLTFSYKSKKSLCGAASRTSSPSCSEPTTPKAATGTGPQTAYKDRVRSDRVLRFSHSSYSMIGSCCVGDLFQNDYKDMIEKFRALPSKPKIYVVLPPPLFPPWPYNMSETAVSVYIARSCRRWRRTVRILCVC